MTTDSFYFDTEIKEIKITKQNIKFNENSWKLDVTIRLLKV